MHSNGLSYCVITVTVQSYDAPFGHSIVQHAEALQLSQLSRRVVLVVIPLLHSYLVNSAKRLKLGPQPML